LPGVVGERAIVLGGSAIGRIAPKSRRIGGAVEPGDAIVCLASTGIHTNGLSLCRKLAAGLPQGYESQLSDGRGFGQALCVPSAIYVPFVRACQQANVELRYAVHMTGHGWRKLMRLDAPLAYRMHDVPPPPPLFEFLLRQAGLSPREAYATFNMGVGFAVMVAPGEAEQCVALARSTGVEAWIGGRVEAAERGRAVVLEPLGIAYEEDTLRVRE
jgi:phosphoribosylformylglycinamidine cyclo-ligase